PSFPLLASLLLLVPGASAYGFRNCIQSMVDPRSFRCIQRFLSDVASAVDDLPASPTVPAASSRHLPQLRKLGLAYNRLEMIEDGAFENLGALVTLNLSYNRLTNLSEGALHGLSNLTHLFLQHNPLSTMHPSALQPLGHLHTLDLFSSRLASFDEVACRLQSLLRLRVLNLCHSNLSSLSSCCLLPPSLSTLHLCNNSLQAVDSGPQLLRHVRRLDLAYNNISNVTSFAGTQLQKLRYLLLKGNPLDVFDLLNVSRLPPSSLDYSGLRLGREGVSRLCQHLGNGTVRRLLLQSNGIQELEGKPFSACPPVRALDLSWNKLRSLRCADWLLGEEQHGALQSPPPPRLRTLHLNINTIAYLHKHALKGLRALTELRLDNNLLTDLYRPSFADLRSLVTLNLRNNRISVLFPCVFSSLSRLQILDLGGNNIRRLGSQSLCGLHSLTKLYLDGNHIKEISSDEFRPVQATLQVLDLGGNSLEYITKRQHKPPPFRYLHRLYDLKLPGQRPYGMKIIPPQFFRGLSALRELFLAENKLLSISPDAFDDLRQLQYLSLADSSNGMQDLPPGIFKSLVCLQRLNLENVGLHSLTLEVFGNLGNLTSLLLAKNQLQTFNASVARALGALRYLDLRKCPLSCTCENLACQGWLPRAGQPLGYVYSFDTHVCFLDAGLYLFSATAPVLLLLTLLPLLHHRAYWRLKYHFYILRSWANEHWRRQDGESFQYDAFVSYNSADEGWVLEQLGPGLESSQGSFRLCLHHRDFEVGKSIVDNIVDSIYHSRKTICVISRSYLQSEWCSLEIQLASYRLFEELKDVLVMVFLEAIPERELSAYHRMRKVMLRKTYISWPPEPAAQPLFWSKLRKALRGRCAEEDEELHPLDGGDEPLLESVSQL
uniref:TIR domain-containing protein n=1 Tax=Pelodiscus sinensis TaxID=13735 RepID=K7G601_PELSI